VLSLVEEHGLLKGKAGKPRTISSVSAFLILIRTRYELPNATTKEQAQPVESAHSKVCIRHVRHSTCAR
jgi:hypothetical protein